MAIEFAHGSQECRMSDPPQTTDRERVAIGVLMTNHSPAEIALKLVRLRADFIDRMNEIGLDEDDSQDALVETEGTPINE